MKVPFIKWSNAVQDFVQDSGLAHEEIDYPLFAKWASDYLKFCKTDQQRTPRIAIIQILNSRGELPGDYDILLQVAGHKWLRNPCDCNHNPQQDCCNRKGRSNPNLDKPIRTTRNDIVQWVQGIGDDCHLEINLKCPACKPNPCTCDKGIIEIDVDRIWEMAHPEIHYKDYMRVGRFGYGPGQNGVMGSSYPPKFELMRYATNDFFNIKNIIGDCPNVDCRDCKHEFVINLPYIEVDFQEGEVLVSYMGKPLDDTGELMIPDHPNVTEGLVAHLMYKWFTMKGLRNKDPFYLQLAKEKKFEAEQHMVAAKAALEIPEFAEIKAWLENSSWLKRVKGWQSNYAGKSVPDQYKNYLE